MATIVDVAKLADVSLKTVSRVINGEKNVTRETRLKVQGAIDQLGYVPSNAARSMRSQRSRLIGIVTGAISVARPSGAVGLPDIFIVQGAQAELARQGIIPLIADTGCDPNAVPSIFRTLLEHRVDGILYIAEYHQEVALPPIADQAPLVLANCFDAAGHHAVVPDDRQGEMALVSGLIAVGHRRIALLTLPKSVPAYGLRLTGYREALQAADIAFDADLIEVATSADRDHEFDGLGAILDRLLTMKNPPTAICCANDKMAMRLYSLLAERGLSVAGDISVVGYDDYRVISEQLVPSLSSASLAYEEIGRRSARALLEIVAGTAKAPEIEKVVGPIMWRDSVRSV